MDLIYKVSELRAAVDKARSEGKRIGFVPTMGALHEGHASLVKRAIQETQFVVVSVFVNPLQFGEGEDFEKYPRALGVDANLLGDLGADVLFAPSAQEVYPKDNPIAQLSAGELGKVFEGKSRPGHFDGMLTVVNRLFNLVTPDAVFFGAKDAQQVALVRRMLAEQTASGQRSPIRLFEGETVRDEHGLALSSRNRFLSAAEVKIARTISAALTAGSKHTDSADVKAAALEVLSAEAKLDYLELVDADSFEVLDSAKGKKARLILACTVGETRLIDNLVIDRTA
jgi:pantoate--beta-alanine ligase